MPIQYADQRAHDAFWMTTRERESILERLDHNLEDLMNDDEKSRMMGEGGFGVNLDDEDFE